MSDNTNSLNNMQSLLPKYYNKFEKGTLMYELLSAFAQSTQDNEDHANRVYSALGIDKTYDVDLEFRWGSLLSTPKDPAESYNLYRNKLKSIIPSLVGGTQDAIIYSIAICIGIEQDSSIVSDYITVCDAWEYNGDINVSDIDTGYGNFICIIDLSVGTTALDIDQDIKDMVNRIKASGTNFYIYYKPAVITRYIDLDKFNYDSLDLADYSLLGQ